MRRAGFSLIEVIVALGLFILFTVGVYGAIHFALKAVFNSRLRIIETAVLNEQVEIIRNLSFFDVGIVNGSPSGVLERTSVVARNGMDFVVTRTIRNIDDPFDGTIGGTPDDTAPADYKLVHIEVVCQDCAQQNPLSFVTRSGPQHLEGDPTHGALFIEVFDANGTPVPGAEVHVVATSTTPTFDFTDTTDNDGMLRLVDLPGAVDAYHITAAKAGYTTDGTIEPSEDIPNPIHRPVTVVAQDVTEVSFTIDRVSQIDVVTLSQVCEPREGVGVDLDGTTLIGTSPDVLKVDENGVTDASGVYSFESLPWDTYTITLPTIAYDVMGAIPLSPVAVAPGVTQPVEIILAPNTTHSLHVTVRDSTTLQPVSGARATITSTFSGYVATQVTDVGFIRQTDWSGGGGQLMIGDAGRYFTDDGGVDVVTTTGDVRLRAVGDVFVASGSLESSIFDVGTTPEYVNLVWEPLGQPAPIGPGAVRFQIAASDTSSTPTWMYLGPDGTGLTYYDETDPIISSIHDGNRYVRYRLFLSTASSTITPVLSDVSMSFTNGCIPGGQTYFGALTTGAYRLGVWKAGYQPYEQTIIVSGDTEAIVDLLPQ